MNIFTSCDDSEVFEEPLVYKTRALNYDNNSVEIEVAVPGEDTNEEELIPGIKAKITLKWDRSSVSTVVSSRIEFEIQDSKKYKKKECYVVEEKAHDWQAYAKYYVEIERCGDSTYTAYQGYVEHSAEIQTETIYLSKDEYNSLSLRTETDSQIIK